MMLFISTPVLPDGRCEKLGTIGFLEVLKMVAPYCGQDLRHTACGMSGPIRFAYHLWVLIEMILCGQLQTTENFGRANDGDSLKILSLERTLTCRRNVDIPCPRCDRSSAGPYTPRPVRSIHGRSVT